MDTDWELNQVQFFSEYECKESALIVPVGRLVSNSENSVNDLFGNKLQGVTIGPTATSKQNYWVGYTSSAPRKLGCVIIKQSLKKSMNEIEVQVRDSSTDSFITLYTIKADEGEDLGSQHSYFQLRSSWSPLAQGASSDTANQSVPTTSSMLGSSSSGTNNVVGITSIGLVLATLVLA